MWFYKLPTPGYLVFLKDICVEKRGLATAATAAATSTSAAATSTSAAATSTSATILSVAAAHVHPSARYESFVYTIRR